MLLVPTLIFSYWSHKVRPPEMRNTLAGCDSFCQEQGDQKDVLFQPIFLEELLWDLTPGACCRTVKEDSSVKQHPLWLWHVTLGGDLSPLDAVGLLGGCFPIYWRPGPLRKVYCCAYWFILILPTSCVADSFICWMVGSLWGFLHQIQLCLLTIEFYYSVIFTSSL